MSLVLTKVQIGQNPTATDNITWERDSTTGAWVMRRGALDVIGSTLLKVNSDGGVNLNSPAFSAYQDTTQSLTSATNIRLNFQAEEYDYGNCFNNTASAVTLNGLLVPAYAFMPNVAGVYSFSGGFRADTSGSFLCALYKNGAAVKNLQYLPSSTAKGCHGTASVYLNGTTDYVELYAYQSAATQNSATGAVNTYFQGHLVRAA